MDILISEKMTGAAFERLKADFKVTADPDLWRDQAKFLATVRDARGLIVRNQTQVTAELLAGAPNLQVIGRAGVGLDNIDVSACTRAGVVIVSTPDQNAISVAELAIGMMLGLARMIPLADRHTKSGGWDRQKFVGTELYGKTVGLVGLGRIGMLTAMRARALGMKIVAHDNFVNPDSFAVTETQAHLMSLEGLLQTADFVSCHVPLTPTTKHLFNYARFSQMKPSAFFLNLARGEVVEEAGLARALQDKKIAGAALDVREQEPATAGPLDAMDNVILAPHIAAFTKEAQARVNAAVCADVAKVLCGERPTNFVNIPKPLRQ